jgi:large subunit ribosomal protein L21
MSYAIIETGGKQVRVEPGRFYDIELLPVEADQSVTIQNVLLVHHNGDVTIGQPFVEGATVEGTVLRHFRGRKVIVYKMKPKKKTRKKRGHRQEITRLMINSISMNGSVLTSSEQTEETPVTDQTAAEAPATEETAEVASAVTAPTVEEAPATEETTEAPSEVTEQTAEAAPATEETAEAPSEVTDQTTEAAPTTAETPETASE